MTIAAAPLLAMALAASPIERETCMPVEQLKESLAAEYGEELVEAGRINAGMVLLLFVSANGATWTIATLVTRGIACVNSTGTHWRWKSPGT
ncbi:MAG: hypothetical protein RLZZ53_666 [Acidobacteriota bacterium]|jgi:hypothetical protein